MLTFLDSTGRRIAVQSAAALAVLREHPRGGDYVIAGATPTNLAPT